MADNNNPVLLDDEELDQITGGTFCREGSEEADSITSGICPNCGGAVSKVELRKYHCSGCNKDFTIIGVGVARISGTR